MACPGSRPRCTHKACPTRLRWRSTARAVCGSRRAAYDDSTTDAVYLVDAVGSTPRKVIADAHTPLGLLWIDDTLYVAGIGGVDAYTGFDGTAFKDHHNVVALPEGVGEVNGLALSNSGRVSLGVSAPCDSCTPTSQYSAAVLSFLPDGTDLRVDASGIRAPPSGSPTSPTATPST